MRRRWIRTPPDGGPAAGCNPDVEPERDGQPVEQGRRPADGHAVTTRREPGGRNPLALAGRSRCEAVDTGMALQEKPLLHSPVDRCSMDAQRVN